MKKKIIISGPALSRSGYGDMTRFAIRALKRHEDKCDLYLAVTNWGATGNLVEENEDTKFIYQLIEKTQSEAQKNNNQLVMDISLQITIPNEWKKMAAYNIGYTAGIETNLVSPAWLQPSSLMDKIIVISEHAKRSFTSSIFGDDKGNHYKISTNIEVCHFPDRKLDYKVLDLELKHEFNFLLVAQWGPRKNVEQAIVEFINEFKNEEVGLLLKVNQVNDSIMDRQRVHTMVETICSNFPNKKCSVSVLHGCLTESEMQGLYRHPKIKAIVSTTHGEGFGFPMFDATLAELPVIATDWSGHLDFLTATQDDDEEKKMFAKIDFQLKPIAQEHVWPGVLEAGTSWAYPTPASVRSRMREVLKDYQRFKSWAKKLAAHNKQKFEESKINKKFVEFVLNEEIIDVSLESLPKISIITSVFKGDEFIRPFLEDITRQTIFKEKCELILVNPNSPGNEEEVIKEYMEKYPNNIVYKKLDSDPGIYACWNISIRSATGDFITNANIDDRKSPNFMEELAKQLFLNKDIDVVYANNLMTNKPNETWQQNTANSIYPSEEFSQESLLRSNSPHCMPMWRKSLHDKCGFFEEKYKSASDWEFWLRCAFNNVKMKKINKTLGLYFFNPSGMSTNKENNIWKKKEEFEIFKKYQNIFLKRKE